ncbi:MAG: CHASE domain-containing protein [Burkholderiaceae bacterium]|nr:CHASE domain-containing protein [Burkholderiaceae bacterium]
MAARRTTVNPDANRPWHWRGLGALLLMALAYAVVGRLSLMLAAPPGYASPLYPPAGMALVFVLVYGRSAALAVTVGAIVVNVLLNPLRTVDITEVVIGLGAGLQALVAAGLVQRLVRQPLTLSAPRDIARFYVFGAVVGCLVGASMATAALGIADIVPVAALPLTWLTWWMGDALGTLIAAPILLTLIGQPREAWAPRRRTVGLTLGIVTTLLVATAVQVAQWDRERVQSSFDRDASAASTAALSQLETPLHALEAVRGLFLGSSHVDAAELRLAADYWLNRKNDLQAIGYHERVSLPDVPAFEQQLRGEGLADYSVVDRTAANSRVPTTASEAYVVRMVEPMQGNISLLGVNALSVPEARAAIEAAVRTDRAVASAAFQLSQDPPDSQKLGVVIYRAVYRGKPATEQERVDSALGVVFVTVRVEDLLHSVLAQSPGHLHFCVTDMDTSARQRQLAATSLCAEAPDGLVHRRTLAVAGRQWELRVNASEVGASQAAGARHYAWLFSSVGLLTAAVLGALLLTVTGRARIIELAVQDRTAALEQQVRERVQVEAAMRESEQRFRNIFNNVPIGVLYTDIDGTVRQANPRFCELVGRDASALEHLKTREFLHPDDIEEDAALFNRLLSGDIATYRRQTRYVAPDGHTVWVQCSVSLLRDESGRPQRIVSVAEDITEHLRLAEAVRAREAAEASNRAKSDFLSRMSHELRTPLNAMLGFAQLLELEDHPSLGTAQRAWVGQIQQAGWHLLEMINDVLDLSRIESGNLRMDLETLDLPELLAATRPLVEQSADLRHIVITEELARGARFITGDATRVKQILTNLLSNAVKYNVDGGRIHLSTRVQGDWVELMVTDTGLGMSTEQMASLFQPFNRLGRETSGTEGTGIGLVISQRLAELMGGELRAASHVGQGSSFILRLPAVGDPDTVPSDLDRLATDRNDYHLRHVHYVEDNETNVEVMRGVLAQRPQVQLDVSITGLDGLAAIRAQRPDVVLLDMHLPDISGLELLRHLKLDPSTRSIPVVAVSADALPAQIDDAFMAGAHRYLTKPVNVSELLSVLDELLSQAETGFH